MKTRTFLVAALAAIAGLTSCSKEEGNVNPKEGELTRVVINMEQPGTRALGGSQGTQNVQFSNGYVYFVNGTTITDIFRLVSGTPAEGSNEVQISTSMSFDEVSGESNHIYIFGNIPAQTATVGQNINTVANSAAQIQSLTNSTTASTLNNYYLFGKTVDPINHSGKVSTAAVTVRPIGTRIEVKELKAVEKHPVDFPQQVTGYRIDGIFMNNIYTKSTLSGTKTAVESDFTYYGKDNGQTPENFVPGKAGGLYDPQYAGITYDANLSGGIATADAGTLIAKPAGTNVWAYNLLAPAGAAFPHIVIRLSNITGVPEIGNELRWLTITKLLNSTTDAEVEFIPGYIYTIESLEFNEYDHLGVAPEMKTVTATVTVSIPQWVNTSVKPW